MNKQGYKLPQKPGDPLRVVRQFTVDGWKKPRIRLEPGSLGVFVQREEVADPSPAMLDQMGLGAYDVARLVAIFPEGAVYLDESDFQHGYVIRPMDVPNLLREDTEDPAVNRTQFQQLRQRLAAFQARTAKLQARQEAILKKYLADAGSKATMDFTDLPASVQSALRRVKDQETLESDVERWLGDNNNPHLRSAANKVWLVTYRNVEGDAVEEEVKAPTEAAARKKFMAEVDETVSEVEVEPTYGRFHGKKASLRDQIQRIATEHPETRAYLVPLLRKYP